MGPLTADKIRPTLVVSSRVYHAPAVLWPVGGGQPLWDIKPRKVGSVPMDRGSDRGRLGALRSGGILRGPSRLDSLVKPEPLRRASGWPFYAKAILEIKLLGITS